MMGKGIARAHWISRPLATEFAVACMQGTANFLVTSFLPVPFLFPWIGMIMVAALFPEPGAVALHKLQAIEPLGAFVEVELRHQQAYRTTVLGFQILTVVLESNHHIIIVEIGKR